MSLAIDGNGRYSDETMVLIRAIIIQQNRLLRQHDTIERMLGMLSDISKQVGFEDAAKVANEWSSADVEASVLAKLIGYVALSFPGVTVEPVKSG